MKKIIMYVSFAFILTLSVFCLSACGTKYEVLVQSNNVNYGTVTGGGEFSEGEVCTLTAKPKGNYNFSEWSDGSTDNPRKITVDKDYVLTAYFVDNVLNVNVTSNNTQYGEVSGSGTYNFNAECTLTATANEGYRFVRWSDGDTQNPRVFNVRKSYNITALFEEGERHVFRNGRTITVLNGTIGYFNDDELGKYTIKIIAKNKVKFGYWENVATREVFSVRSVESVVYNDLDSNITLKAIDSAVGLFFATATEELSSLVSEIGMFEIVAKLDWLSTASHINPVLYNVVYNGNKTYTVNLKYKNVGDIYFYVLPVYDKNGVAYIGDPRIFSGTLSITNQNLHYEDGTIYQIRGTLIN